MYSFLILSIPATVIFYCCIHTEYSFKSFFGPIAIGLTAGIISAIFKEYFIFSAYVATSGFFEHFLHILKTTFFPPVILFAFWDLFSKDGTRYKTTSAFPLLASFYAIFLPYISISSPEKHSFFFLFENKTQHRVQEKKQNRSFCNCIRCNFIHTAGNSNLVVF